MEIAVQFQKQFMMKPCDGYSPDPSNFFSQSDFGCSLKNQLDFNVFIPPISPFRAQS